MITAVMLSEKTNGADYLNWSFSFPNWLLATEQRNKPSPSYLVPLLQNESWCKTFRFTGRLIDITKKTEHTFNRTVSNKDPFSDRGKWKLGNKN